MQQRDKLVSVIIIVAVLGFFGYRFFFSDRTDRTEEVVIESRTEEGFDVASSTITYDIPGNRTHTIRFAIFTDAEGTIEEFEFVDTTDPNHQENVDEFEAILLERVKGQKLADLPQIDMVGTSTLTTGAFNKALAEIQAQ